jgi:RNA polymerase sigma factor (TIGR02999 family)
MGDITSLLNRWTSGDSEAINELMPAVYREMKRLANHVLRSERPNNTLQCTALVHEAYVRLVDQNRIQWKGRAHFFGAAANAMRRILVDHARQRQAVKRGAGARKESLDDVLAIAVAPDLDLLAVDLALHELSLFDSERARIVELRYFGGLTIEEAAEVLGVSVATVNRDWTVARAWLYQRLNGRAENTPR